VSRMWTTGVRDVCCNLRCADVFAMCDEFEEVAWGTRVDEFVCGLDGRRIRRRRVRVALG